MNKVKVTKDRLQPAEKFAMVSFATLDIFTFSFQRGSYLAHTWYEMQHIHILLQ